MDFQIPSLGMFNSSMLQWAQVYNERSKYKLMRQAYIPWSRLEDFVQGEARIGEFKTTFKKYTSHRRKPGQLIKPSKDAWIESIV